MEVVWRVRSWAEELKTGEIRSRAEIARREYITAARVSQLWPLAALNNEQVEHVQNSNRPGTTSIRTLIQIARNLASKKKIRGTLQASQGN